MSQDQRENPQQHLPTDEAQPNAPQGEETEDVLSLLLSASKAGKPKKGGKTKEKKPRGRNRIPLALQQPIKLTATLFVIATITAGLLGLADAITREPIRQHKEQADEAARLILYPGAYFEKIETQATAPVQEIHAVFYDMELDQEGNPVAYDVFMGYLVKVAPRGYSDSIEMMVGIGPDKAVTGVEILGMREAAGIGDRIFRDDFLAGYQGKTAGLKPGRNGNEVEAITGATVTSNAVTAGVAAALDAIDNIPDLPDAPDYQTGGEQP